MKCRVVRSAVVALLVAGSGLAAAQDMTGAGATFPAPLYAKWADTYHKATGARMNYQAIGSGAVTCPLPPYQCFGRSPG